MNSKAVIILLGILVFLLGGIAGAISHSLYQEYLRAEFIKATSQSLDIVGSLAKELDLDSKQTQSLRTIYDESRDRSIALSQELWPRYQDIYNETEQKIKDILREDQRVRYEEFLRQFQIPSAPETAVK
ncbi:MAG: hypothetical protein P8Z37_02660 [Acidobacteriota bacterium]